MSGLFSGDSAQPAGSSQQRSIAKYGIFSEPVEAGTTVGEARRKLQAAGNMPGDTKAYINGDVANDDAVIPAGATVNFMKRSGEKGEGL